MINLDTLETLQNLDRSLLTDLVRKDQRNPSFELLDWAVEPMRHAKILASTGGLYRFSGHGQDADGIRPWAIVLKILNKPAQGDEDQRDIFYWKRELLLSQSGLLTDLPNSVGVPRSYGVVETDDGGWLWMEHIVEATERQWALEHFRFAAYQFGQLAAAYLTGKPLPDQPWLSSPLFHNLINDDAFWPRYMNPDSAENAWQSARVQRAFSQPLRSQILRFWAEKGRFTTAMDRLPQVLCHNDLNRRNLMLRMADDGQQELIVLDWAWCGSGALGLDAGWLVGDGLYFFDYDPARAAELESAVMEGYLAGLRDGGWSGDERLARLGYLIIATLWMACLPGWVGMMLDGSSEAEVMDMYGHPAETVLPGWVKLAEFLSERAHEARQLIRELNFD